MESSGPSPANPVQNRASVLVVDDDPSVRELFRAALGRRGYSVTCAEEYEEAAAILGHRVFDLACIDLDLAGLRGLEGLELISDLHVRRPESRILVETGNADPLVHRACYERGADAVYLKSGSLLELQRLVEEVLAEESR